MSAKILQMVNSSFFGSFETIAFHHKPTQNLAQRKAPILAAIHAADCLVKQRNPYGKANILDPKFIEQYGQEQINKWQQICSATEVDYD